MIVPMKKVCLMVQGKTEEAALLKLREAGVVHLEKSSMGDSISKASEHKAKIESAFAIMSDVKAPKKKNTAPAAKPPAGQRQRRSIDIYGTEEQSPFSLDAVRNSARPSLPDYIIGIGKERKTLQERRLYLYREISRLESWGDFDPDSVKEMASLGLPVYLYELNHEAFAALDPNTRYIKIGSNKASVRIAVLYNELPGIQPFQLPEKSLHNLEKEVDEIKLDIEEVGEKLKNMVDRLAVLTKEKAGAEQDLEFENAAAGMEKVEGIPSEYGLSYLTGFVPKDEIEKLKIAAKENNWAFSMDDPAESDDKVPTKLKNNKFVDMLIPITDFLGIVPGYREVDVSPWFLLFFCIFFGMIFGDAAYGLILVLLAMFGILKTARKGVPLALKMLLLLGTFNTAWGVMTCSWFGVDVEKVPKILQDISMPLFSTAKTDAAMVNQNLQIFCFSLGLLQLTIAHIIGIFRYIKSLKVFGEIGQILMLLGMYNVILFLVVSNDNVRTIPILPVSLYLLASGFVLNFVFGSYEGSIGRSILESCKNIISVVLGIVNIFSDIMSYIRLWAVGLAGAAIATTVNTMAGPMLGSFIIFAGIILLIFGHGLNLILNVLSVLVHGVRLNTLEFSQHLGLAWSGTAYRPFADRAQKSG